MAEPAPAPRRPPAHGSVQGLAQPPRGDPDDYQLPMPVAHNDPHAHAQPSPVPKHGGHVHVRTAAGWVPGLCTTIDRVNHRAYCTWVEPGRFDWMRVEAWVPWADVEPATPLPQPKPPLT